MSEAFQLFPKLLSASPTSLRHCTLPAVAERSGLFGASATASDAASIEPSSMEKRTKLFPYDSVPSQLFEPFGPSMASDGFWHSCGRGAAAGNKKAQFHTALAASQDDDAWRVGSGLSLTAQSLLAAIKDEPYKRVIAEADALVSYLRVPDMGSFRQLKKRRVQTAAAAAVLVVVRLDAAVANAAKQFHQWLSKEVSPLRHLLNLLAGKGSFYGGHVNERVARACILHKPANEADFIAAALARSRTTGSAAAAGPAPRPSGLFGEPAAQAE